MLVADADVARRRCVSALEQEDQKRRQQQPGVAKLHQQVGTVTAQQDQVATVFEKVQRSLAAQSESELTLTRTEAWRKVETARVEAKAAVMGQAAVRAALVQAKEREAEEQRLRATTLDAINFGVEVQQREAHSPDSLPLMNWASCGFAS